MKFLRDIIHQKSEEAEQAAAQVHAADAASSDTPVASGDAASNEESDWQSLFGQLSPSETADMNEHAPEQTVPQEIAETVVTSELAEAAVDLDDEETLADDFATDDADDIDNMFADNPQPQLRAQQQAPSPAMDAAALAALRPSAAIKTPEPAADPAPQPKLAEQPAMPRVTRTAPRPAASLPDPAPTANVAQPDPEPAQPEIPSAAIEVPPPAAGRSTARAGRARTRILGFNPGAAASKNPFDNAANAQPETLDQPDGYTQFPVGWLVVTDGPGRGAAFTLFTGVAQIGRGEGQTVRLDFGDNSISRENHAAIAFDPEESTFFIGHGGKANLVRCNGMPVLSTQPLTAGDKIRIGETTLLFTPLCGPDFGWNQPNGNETPHAARG